MMVYVVRRLTSGCSVRVPDFPSCLKSQLKASQQTSNDYASLRKGHA